MENRYIIARNFLIGQTEDALIDYLLDERPDNVHIAYSNGDLSSDSNRYLTLSELLDSMLKKCHEDRLRKELDRITTYSSQIEFLYSDGDEEAVIDVTSSMEKHLKVRIKDFNQKLTGNVECMWI